MVVDDEEVVRQVLRRWLISAGYEVIEAPDADGALNLMATTPAAVVLSDVQMPGHDGLWLTAELRKHYPATAVVLATGLATIPSSVSMQSGVLAYLVKPFRSQDVIEAVKTAYAWHVETTAKGPRSDDSVDKVAAWLDSLRKGSGRRD